MQLADGASVTPTGASEGQHVRHDDHHLDAPAVRSYWRRQHRLWRRRYGRDLGRILQHLNLIADHDLRFHRHHTHRIHEWQRLLDDHACQSGDFHIEHGRIVWVIRGDSNIGSDDG